MTSSCRFHQRARLLAAVLWLLALAPAARATDGDCDPARLADVDDWLDAHPWRAGMPDPQQRIAAACKAWPTDKNLTIVVAAYAIGDGRYDKDTIVALVDGARNAVLAAYQGVLVEVDDLRVYEGSLAIDTARYDLAPGVRAFGIDVTSSGHSGSAAEAGAYQGRTLFVRNGAMLRPVLDGFMMHTWTWPGHDDPRGPERHAFTLAMGATSTHGYRDIVVTDTTEADPPDRPLQRTRFTLQYDGTRYDRAGHGSDWAVEPEPVPDAKR